MRVLSTVRAPLTAVISSTERAAAASLSFSIFSNAGMSGFALHTGGWDCGPSCEAAVPTIQARKATTAQPLKKRIVLPIDEPRFRCKGLQYTPNPSGACQRAGETTQPDG